MESCLVWENDTKTKQVMGLDTVLVEVSNLSHNVSAGIMFNPFLLYLCEC